MDQELTDYFNNFGELLDELSLPDNERKLIKNEFGFLRDVVTAHVQMAKEQS